MKYLPFYTAGFNANRCDDERAKMKFGVSCGAWKLESCAAAQFKFVTWRERCALSKYFLQTDDMAFQPLIPKDVLDSLTDVGLVYTSDRYGCVRSPPGYSRRFNCRSKEYMSGCVLKIKGIFEVGFVLKRGFSLVL